MKKEIIINTFHLFLNKGVNALVPLLLIPLLNEKFGIVGYGQLVYIQAMLTVFLLIADYGFIVTGTRDISLFEENIEERNKIASAIFFIKALLISVGFIACVVYFIFFYSGSQFVFLLSMAVLISFFMQSFVPSWFFQGIKKNKYISSINFITKILFFISVFYFLNKGATLIAVPVLEFISYLIAIIICIYLLYRYEKFKFKFPSLSLIKDQLKQGASIFIISILNWLILAGSIFFVGKYTSKQSEEYGYYAAFSRLAYYIFAIIQPINQAIFPYFVSSFSNKAANASKFVKSTFLYYSILVIVLVVGSILGSYLFFKFFFNQQFNSVLPNYIKTFYILIVWVGLVLYNNFISLQLFVSKGKDIVYRNLYLLNTFVTVILFITLIPKYNSIGAAIALLSGELIMLLIYSRKIFVNKEVLLS